MAKVIKQRGLDAILAELDDNQLKPGEFTCVQVYQKQRANGGEKTMESVRGLLKRMEANGDLLSRSVVVNGKRARAYRPK